MRWDLGADGLAVLGVMALAFGTCTWLVFRGRHGWWPAVVGTVAFLAGRAFISEVVFGWATATELQPNIGDLDGRSAPRAGRR